VFQLNIIACEDIYEIKVCSVVTKYPVFFLSLVEIPKEHKAELRLSWISSFVRVVEVYVGLQSK